MSMSEYIAVVPFSAILIIPMESEPKNFACLDENQTWTELDWGESNLFPKELNGWILNKTAQDLTGIREGYDLHYWEYHKNGKVIGWIDSYEEDEYFIFSEDRDSLLLFLQDYSLSKNIRTRSEVKQYF